MKRVLQFSFVLIFLAGCASAGLQTADTFNQKYGYALAIHTSVLQAAAQGVGSGSLSSADGEAILKKADDARALLDVAKAANAAGDTAGANNNLQIATAALTALQTYLNTHGSKP